MNAFELLTILTVVMLAALNVAQFLFWAAHAQKLVDKLMSRNYAEYSLSNASSQAPKTARPVFDGGVHEDFGPLSGVGINL